MNIFAAIWRFITFQNLRQGAKVQNAGDAVFTKDAAGRAAAASQGNARVRRRARRSRAGSHRASAGSRGS